MPALREKNLLSLLALECRKILLLFAFRSMPRCSRAADKDIAVFDALSVLARSALRDVRI